MKIDSYKIVEGIFFNGHVTNIWLGCKIENKKDNYFFTTNPLLYASDLDNNNFISYKK